MSTGVLEKVLGHVAALEAAIPLLRKKIGDGERIAEMYKNAAHGNSLRTSEVLCVCITALFLVSVFKPNPNIKLTVPFQDLFR